MQIRLVLVLFLSHLLADFVFQTNGLVKSKRIKKKLWSLGIFKHSVIFFVIALSLTLIIAVGMNSDVLKKIVIVSIVHYFIDYFKVRLIEKIDKGKKESIDVVNSGNQSEEEKEREIKKIIKVKLKKDLGLFYGDQLCHFVSIIGLTYWGGDFFELNRRIDWINNTLVYKIIILILVVFVSGYIIGHLFQIIYRDVGGYKEFVKNKGLIPLDSAEEELSDKVKAGQFIGLLERALLIMILLSDVGLKGIGYIFAAKSISRFKLLETKHFSEYYLIGTMLSYGVVVIGFYCIQKAEYIISILLKIEEFLKVGL